MNNSNLHHSPRLGAEAAAALNAVEDQLALAFDRMRVAIAEFTALAQWSGAIDTSWPEALPWVCEHGGCTCIIDSIGDTLQRRRARMAEDTAESNPFAQLAGTIEIENA